MKTTAEPYRVLLVEGDPEDARHLQALLDSTPARQFQSQWITSLEAASALIDSGSAELVLLDLAWPECTGIEAFERLSVLAPQMPFIVLGKSDDEALALQVVQAGAQDYLAKGMLTARGLYRTMLYAVERERAEQELQREREFLHAMLDSSPDNIYYKDSASRFILINHSLAKFFGLNSPEEAIGKTDFDFHPHAAAVEKIADERRVMETGESMVGKVERDVETDGQFRWVLTTKMPLRDQKGRIIGTLGLSRDVTMLQEMEEALSRERNLLRTVIDNLPDFIFAKDAAGHYILNNQAHTRLLKCKSPEDILGKSVFDLFPPSLAERYNADDQTVFASHEPIVDKVEPTLKRDGSERWISTTKVPFFETNGTLAGLVSIARDITAQKRAEEELQRTNAELSRSREELLEAMGELRAIQLQLIEAEKLKLVGRLAAGVAHEVKNPLAIIGIGMDYLLRQKFDDPNVALILQQISDAVRRADSVVRGLLDFSAPKKLQKEPVDVNPLIQNALRLLHVPLQTGHIVVEQELDAELPVVRLDGAKIEQAFVNIFTNAIHAMSGGGTLTVRTSSRQLTGVGENISTSEGFRLGDRLVVIEISDTGSGLPEGIAGKIFEPFFTTKATGKGTGLGLTVTKSIIDLHRGTIEARNRPERGVCVTIVFKADEPL